MGRISPNIREEAKVTILGTVVGERIARPLAGDMWKTKRLSATVLRAATILARKIISGKKVEINRFCINLKKSKYLKNSKSILGTCIAATGVNRWIISLDANPEVEIEVSAGRMKFVAVTTPNNDLNNNNDNIHEEPVSEPEINISSESEKEEEEVNINNNNKLLWTDAAIIIDSCKVFRSYSNVTVVHISDIEHATPRQFFERFLPIEYIMSTVLPSTNTRARASERYWKDLTWMEFMKFIGILTIMTYVRCADICDYWSIEQKTGGVSLGFGQYMSHRRFRDIVKFLTLTDTPIDDNDPFYFARKFHNEFNENLAKAITPGSILCIDESMCQWMGKIDKGPFQRKIPRKPHPIGCEFKTMADARTNLFLQLDPVEPPEYSSKKKFAEHSATIATMLRLTEPWFSSGRTIIADSWFGSVKACTTLYKHGLYSILQLKKRRYWAKNIPCDITDALESDYGLFISQVGKFDDVDLTLCSLRDRKNIVLLASCSTTNLKNEVTRYIKGHDPVEPPEYSSKKKFAEHSATIATMLRLTEPWFSSGRTIIADSWFGSVKACTTLYKHGLYSILQLKKRRYWPKNIPCDITDALESDYGLFISQVGKFDDVDLTLCSLRDRKNIVLLASCSTTNLKNEVTRYIKGHGNVKFHRPAVFDEYNEYRSTIDILNNLRDNALSYHDVLTTKCSENRILAFYFSVVEANSYSAYCQFVPGKKNMKHVDFRKQLVISIFDYYSEDETVSNRTKKRKRKDSNDIEHDLINIKDDSSSSQLKGKRIQRRCISCHKRTTTGCKCSMPQAMCSNCWANHIRNTYNPIRTG
ncbi:hypothetical protein Glove_441g18 [Diversispora epigaea]|uniref:PiggyBac transposable element-derived protein domain-containing protein n=1 Tax=Diversispora epigaea TaxID=1348612 RepID=A0A397GQZ2_9GLOM|nr:hypothetical protein Glove_441g18 [Diversispora epigaea]